MKRKTKTENNVVSETSPLGITTEVKPERMAETKIYTMRLITKDVSFKYNDVVTEFTISNVKKAGDFIAAISGAMAIVFNDKDESYRGLGTWAHEFALRFAVISTFTNINFTNLGMDEIWFFVLYSPAFEMVMDLCSLEASWLMAAIDEAIENKKAYTVRKSDIIDMLSGAIDKIGDMSEGFQNLDLGALTSFLNNAKGLQGSELVQAVLGTLGGLLGDREETPDEVVIGSQRQEAKDAKKK